MRYATITGLNKKYLKVVITFDKVSRVKMISWFHLLFKENLHMIIRFYYNMFRFGVDLDKTFQNGKQPLSDDVIGTLAVQVYDCRPPLIPEVKTQSERKKRMKSKT